MSSSVQSIYFGEFLLYLILTSNICNFYLNFSIFLTRIREYTNESHTWASASDLLKWRRVAVDLLCVNNKRHYIFLRWAICVHKLIKTGDLSSRVLFEEKKVSVRTFSLYCFQT